MPNMIDDSLIAELGGKPSHSVEEVTCAVNIAVGSSAAVTMAKEVSDKAAEVSGAMLAEPSVRKDHDLEHNIEALDAPVMREAMQAEPAPDVEMDEPAVEDESYDGPDIG